MGSNSHLWDRKPVGETIMAKVARDFVLRKAGIDPRTPAEIAKDEEEKQRAIRWWNKTGGEV